MLNDLQQTWNTELIQIKTALGLWIFAENYQRLILNRPGIHRLDQSIPQKVPSDAKQDQGNCDRQENPPVSNDPFR